LGRALAAKSRVDEGEKKRKNGFAREKTAFRRVSKKKKEKIKKDPLRRRESRL
jgi:hypothetical protein